jgi:2-polyprenyl-3-methyl-5-hydroxy-6-metoxy-1,4-benzoquinol methylase
MIDAARKTFSGEFRYRHLWWFKRLALRWLERHGKGRLLDVGCGPGTFLLVARTRGWNVAGVEPTAEPAELASSFALDVFNGTAEDFARQSPLRFHAITSFEVLEHVTRPIAMLRAMRELLQPGGHIVVSVPNLDDPYCLRQQIPSAVPPVHINFFNRRSLGESMRLAGLEVLKFASLPIPSSSVRNVHGKFGFILRAPILLAMRLLGRADGTVLVALARRN